MSRITRIRAYNPATATGTFIITNLPARFPAFLAAVLYLKAAMKAQKARIRVEYTRPWARCVEFDLVTLCQEALKRGLLRPMAGAVDFSPSLQRFQCWAGFTPAPSQPGPSPEGVSNG